MRQIAVLVLMLALLGACAPMAMFASSTGPGYNGLDRNFGTFVSHDNVDTFCLNPRLRLVIWDFEGYFGRKVVMNSGYRSPAYNASVGGAERSHHMNCEAADFHIPGIEKSRLIAYAMSNGLVGGLGCYPNQNFIHVDVRERPAGYTRPVTFNGC